MKVIVTGATGMVGEGVMHECLQDQKIEKVLIINRRPSGFSHPKLEEVILKDFFKPQEILSHLGGYDGCFFCLGVSSVGMNEETYTKLTYDLTIGFAEVVKKANPNITFNYVSGRATDGTEKGRIMWARVKGKTENNLLSMFDNGYAFRPGIMTPTPGLKNTLKLYSYLGWMMPLFKLFAPGSVSTLSAVGVAMIKSLTVKYPKRVLEVSDIKALAASE